MPDTTGIEALGRVPSGLFIVTCEGKTHSHAFLASWVMQTGFSPPSLSVAIKQDRPIMRDLKPGTVFCVNQLAKDDPLSKALMGRFAKGTPMGENAYAESDIRRAANGGCYLPDALAYMECRLMRTLEPSTEHNLIVGEIVSGEVLRPGEPWVHIRKSGAQY